MDVIVGFSLNVGVGARDEDASEPEKVEHALLCSLLHHSSDLRPHIIYHPVDHISQLDCLSCHIHA